MPSIVPEVDPDTRVLAILATDNHDPSENGDGWFLADWCLLNQLLRGQGKEQVWLHTKDIDDVVRAYGPIVHGSERFPPRKVVYGSHGQTLENTRSTSVFGLKELFLQELRRMVAKCRPADRLLLILIGHGQFHNFGLVVGGRPDDFEASGNHLITKDDVDSILFHHGPPGLSVCLLCSSCYSGNWVCSSGSRSVMAAVDAGEESLSYFRSTSGMMRGSWFIGAAVDIVRRTGTTEGSYKELCDSIVGNLWEKFPLLVAQCPPEFSAQGDEWDVSVPEATGLAQRKYANRYDGLPTYPSNPESNSRVVATGSGRRSRLLRALVKFYMSSHPGLDNAASNIRINGLCRRFLNRQGPPLHPNDLGWLAIALLHRNRTGLVVDEYAKILRLQPFPCFDAWDYFNWKANHRDLKSAYNDALDVVLLFYHLIPACPEVHIENYQPTPKPQFYYAAAATTVGISQAELYKRLAALWRHVHPGKAVPAMLTTSSG